MLLFDTIRNFSGPAHRIDPDKFKQYAAESVDWLVALGVSKPGDRYHAYLKDIDASDLTYESFDSDSQEVRAVSYAGTEIIELIQIRDSLQKQEAVDFIDTLKKVTSGQQFRNAAQDDPARNFLFELSLASRFVHAGLDITLNQLADIELYLNNTVVFVEAKRLTSEKQLRKRIGQANCQLSQRIRTYKGRRAAYGMAAVDLTDLINPGNAPIFVHSPHAVNAKNFDLLYAYLDKNLDRFYKNKKNKIIGILTAFNSYGVFTEADGKKVAGSTSGRGYHLIKYHTRKQVNEVAEALLSNFSEHYIR